ncbi:LPS export ABC transporter ATP-binding protein [Chlamydia pecorum]|uniref:ABC transporter ATPase n=2 Tax=Chlamydia pecorum TaxID=85991 RepID=A0AA34RCT8_CHLPE|nr:LPS export ABC transporter ATP-binding protein [Chlamydia pecorum]AEB41326.1 ABC transporter ATPase [Chlamydia pecorum E58]AGW37532.1 putative ABC transporter ATP-binding protein [Chlamydia pecorum PV3056/3]AGW38453.1 putative ABC transporter ATP-binding protein [Chlamydia pecorum W73]AGW39378.1 putative ABC transporter ATP-binding protein [Chlamydia pecorum P787]ETF38677.1 ABC transporter ATPase [Chlamydia pecorum VR629]
MPILSVRNLVKKYNKKPVTNDVSFDINPGEIVGLLGPNGAGKTTAFYQTVGLIRPDAGQILFKNIDVTRKTMDSRARLGIGYLAQEPTVFKDLTTEANLSCILEIIYKGRKQQSHLLHTLVEDLQLTTCLHKKAGSLSGGERRRLEIACVLALNPSVLLLDEPFANVDPLVIQNVKYLIKILAGRGIGILITDHNAKELLSIADRCYLIIDGKIFFEGSASQMITNPMVKQHYLGDSFTY